MSACWNFSVCLIACFHFETLPYNNPPSSSRQTIKIDDEVGREGSEGQLWRWWRNGVWLVEAVTNYLHSNQCRYAVEQKNEICLLLLHVLVTETKSASTGFKHTNIVEHARNERISHSEIQKTMFGNFRRNICGI